MKKILCLIILAFALVGCESKENKDITILVPNGIPLIALGDLVDEYQVETVVGPELLVSGLISKSHDLIIAPLNLGAKLYLNNSSTYKLAALITFGNTYLVSRKSTNLETIQDVDDEEILAYGRNAVPDLILKKALDFSNVNVQIIYQNGIDEVIPFFVSNPNNPNNILETTPKYILAAEPYLTKLELDYQMELNILDLQEVLGDKFIPQAAIFINPESKHYDWLEEVLKKVKNNILSLNQDPKSYAEKITSKHQYFKNLGAKTIEHCIPRSNINYLVARENINLCEAFFQMLNDYNPNLLGGQIPNQEFYE
jgi:NitT/TauT family transport system substrate-binding protein